MRRVISNAVVIHRRPFLVLFFTLTTLIVTIFVNWSYRNENLFSDEDHFYFDFDFNIVEVTVNENLRVKPTSECACKKHMYIYLEKQANQLYSVHLVKKNFQVICINVNI